MKTCNGPCKQTKDDSEFFIKRYKSGKTGLRAYCKSCGKAARDAWRKSSPKDNDRNKLYNKENAEVIKWKKLVKYWPGATWEQAKYNYNTLLYKQGGKCAICKDSESAAHHISKQIKNLAVDHDHETGKVRGLLCSSCNRAIGLLQEDRTRIEMALVYLKTGEQ